MKIKVIGCLLVLLLALPAMAAPPKGYISDQQSQVVDNTSYIDANTIFMFVTNHGNFGRDLAGVFGNDYGTYWPYTGYDVIANGEDVRSPLYAAGLWIGGVDSATGETRVVIAEYDDEYVPGPMEEGTFMTDRPEFRVYKLYADSLKDNPNQDYLDYLTYAIDQGAPWKLDEEEDVVPDFMGSQMLWAVYNDADPEQHANGSGETLPLGIEVQQTTFAYTREDPLGNIIFVRLRAFNKGGNTIQNCFFSVWCDPDLGGSGDDLVACDTNLSLGYIYNDNNNDQQYGSTPPTYGVDFFQGPLIYTGDTNDVAKMWGDTLRGYVNMGMTSFNKYINGTDPDNFGETYNYMRGLERDGSDYINPVTGLVSKFFHSGDPVTGEGDIDFAPADRRFMMSTGPITFRPGDSTEILIALIVGNGADRLSSISVLKYYDEFAQSAYDIDFDIAEPPAAPVVTPKSYDGYVVLEWTDASETEPGDYAFEGYTVYQGESAAGPWKRIANYDVVNGIANILDVVIDPATGVPETRGVKFGSDNEIRHHYSTDQDQILGGPIHNVTTYYYKVEAYSYDAAATPRTLTSATAVTVVPQAPPAGTVYYNAFDDQYDVEHVGVPDGYLSDGSVAPIVINPANLTGHEYRVTFGVYQPDTIVTWECARDTTIWATYDTLTDTCDFYLDTILSWVPILCVDTTIDSIVYNPPGDYCDTTITIPDVVFWTLTDLTTNTIILDTIRNQSGNEDYPIVDGMQVKVTGPDPGVGNYEIPSGVRRFTWSNASMGFEGFNGAIGWETPAHYFGYGGTLIPPAQHVSVLLTLAQAAVDTLSYWACTDMYADGSACSLYVEVDPDTLESMDLVDSVYTTGLWDTDDENVSYAYRYLRGATGAPAKPEFAPYIINAVGGYSFQDFEKSVPMSVWNVDVDPPQRLAVGFLENNTPYGIVDGKYWPSGGTVLNGTEGTSSREWMFIYLADYSETVDPALATDILQDPTIPVLYWMSVNRRGDVPYSPGGTGTDEFLIIPNYINLPLDTFFFSSVVPDTATTGTESDLEAIKAVPNPYYLTGGYDPSPGSYKINFHHLPQTCTITIFNLSGDLIRTIQKDDATAITGWDLLTDRGLPVASGIYIYVVDAPGFGQKIGKMAVFVQAEVLKIY